MIRINLLPKALRPKMIINLDLIFAVFAVVTVLGIGVSFMRLQTKVSKVTREFAELEIEATEQRSRIELLRAQETTRDMSATQALIAKRKKWNPFLKELTYILPTDVWVTRLILKGNNENVGVQMMGLAPSQKSVNRFLGRLERSISYQSVKLNSAKVMPEYTPSLYAFDFSVGDVLNGSVRGLASEGKQK